MTKKKPYQYSQEKIAALEASTAAQAALQKLADAKARMAEDDKEAMSLIQSLEGMSYSEFMALPPVRIGVVASLIFHAEESLKESMRAKQSNGGIEGAIEKKAEKHRAVSWVKTLWQKHEKDGTPERDRAAKIAKVTGYSSVTVRRYIKEIKQAGS